MFFKSIIYNHFVSVVAFIRWFIVMVRHVYWSDSTPRQLVSVSLNPLKRCSGCWGNPSRWWKKNVYGSKWLERDDLCLLTVITCLFRRIYSCVIGVLQGKYCFKSWVSKASTEPSASADLPWGEFAVDVVSLRLHTIFVHINLEGPYRMIWDQLSCVIRESDAKAAHQRFLHLIPSLMNTSDLWRCLW